MDPDPRVERLRSQIRYRRHLVESGRSDRAIARAVERGQIVRILRGAFMDREIWRRLSGEERLIARAAAKSHESRSGPPIFSHTTAAAIWGLPLFRHADVRLDLIIDPDSPARSSRPVRRHVLPLEPGDVVERGGLRYTSLERTVIDLARSAPDELAIGCIDRALRMRALEDGRDGGDVESRRGALLERLASMAGSPGSARAVALVEGADHRADSVLESVSRLYLRRLGVAVEIQVPVIGNGGTAYWTDFEFLDAGAYGEVDGAIKYSDPRSGDGRVPVSSLIAEKEREDEIRGVTGKRLVRWGSRHLADQYALGSRLLAFGIPVPAMQ